MHVHGSPSLQCPESKRPLLAYSQNHHQPQPQSLNAPRWQVEQYFLQQGKWTWLASYL